jgi:hypothetical protein
MQAWVLKEKVGGLDAYDAFAFTLKPLLFALSSTNRPDNAIQNPVRRPSGGAV